MEYLARRDGTNYGLWLWGLGRWSLRVGGERVLKGSAEKDLCLTWRGIGW